MSKKTGIIKKTVLGAGLLAAACGGEIAYFYGRTMKRGRAKTERTIKMAGTDWNQYMPLSARRLCWKDHTRTCGRQVLTI